jgi:release factor glutamine methyltransferase
VDESRTVAGAIAAARDALRRAGVLPDEAAGDAEVLARHLLGWDLTQFTLHRNDPIPAGFDAAYAQLIERRSAREPVSQIVGHREFWGLDFEVTPDVLTPRPETEMLIEAALEVFPPGASIAIMDVGTGSGCLAIALAKEFPNARLTASDVSLPALAVARRNAEAHRVSDRITFLHSGDLAREESFDLIVSNPPYISLRETETLPAEVRDHEPHVALFAGEDGLDAYRQLLAGGVRALRPLGRMILELGYDQAQRVTALARDAGWEVEAVRRDLQSIERTLTLRRAG